MTSMLEQYERAATASNAGVPPGSTGASTGGGRSIPSAADIPSGSGYVTVHLEEETPMFHRQKMNLNPSDSIVHFAVANDVLSMAMANCKIFRMDLKNPDRREEITFGKYIPSNAKPIGVWMDPSGTHSLISFSSKSKDGADLFYLHSSSSKPKVVAKAKSVEVTAVAWNPETVAENSTGPILIGTSKGIIIETDMSSKETFQSGVEQYWKQVFDVGRGKDVPITAIEIHRRPDNNKFYIFVATMTRLYQFYGNVSSDDRPMVQSIFNSYLNRPETDYLEVQSSLNASKLQLFFSKGEKTLSSIAWLTESEIHHGELDPIFNGKAKVSDMKELSVSLDLSIDVSNSDGTDLKKVLKPISFVLTEFHILIIYNDRMRAVCLLDDEIVFEEFYHEMYGNLINIVTDATKRTVWAVTNKTVFRYKITREERNIWKIYTKRNEFHLARKYCENNPAYLDSINIKEAEMWFKRGEYNRSAEIFAETQTSFEGVCLKFLEIQEIDALKLFLERRLQKLEKKDTVQITMLIIWIFELYLTQISNFSSTGDSHRRAKIQKSFEDFIMSPNVSECVKLNKLVIYDLMASHGDKENLLKLTVINKDFENVIRQNIFKKSYKEALEVLKSQNKINLFYQFVPVLLQEIPVETVNALIEQGKKLNPSKLLPAFMSCDADKVHAKEMIRYLEFCTETMMCSDRAIHNYLLSLYAANDNKKLLSYLRSQGENAATINYDVHYALRLCKEKNLTDACIQLSCLLEQWETAVELALTLNEQLAEKIANMPEDEVLKKKLWLKIAQFVISKKEDVKEAMEFLKRCELLKIEDILTFFSDFVTIDHFREPICDSLQEYNQQIQDLHEEMEEATKSADTVRSEIQTFRNHCTAINISEVCVLCEITLLLRPFYLFPCGHKFHSDCLQNELLTLLGPAKSNRLQELQRLLQTSQAKETIKNDIDNIIASECLYCGEYMIQAIDAPFIPNDKWDQVIKEWE